VRFYWQYCPGGACGAENLVRVVTTPPYNAVWTFPTTCSLDDRYLVRARAEDLCGNATSPAAGTDATANVRIPDIMCFRANALRNATGAWVSELSVPDGRGQVVVDGTQAVFPASGIATFSLPMGPGGHRFEATLVDGAGRPGTWRFDLSTLGLRPGSLRVVAGEVAQAGSTTIVFRLRGKPGERVVFGFDAGGAP
jgi:hypothetical protein